MRKNLEQGEIDALFSKAQSAQQTVRSKPAHKVVPWDLRHSNQLTEEQVSAVTTLNDSLARRLSGSLGAHLRSAFEMNAVSVEQMTYREFLKRMPELTYFASMHVMPIDARAAIQLDVALAYPMIDLVLGGTGTDTMEIRELTEIEEQTLESVVKLILLEIHAAWARVLDLEFQFEQRQRNVELQNTMVLAERILCLTFEARLSEFTGTIAMIFPAVIANALLRRLSVQGAYSERIPSRDSYRRMRERILDCKFKLDLSLPLSPVTIGKLLDLNVGDVLMLPKRVREPVYLNVAGKAMFRAQPVRSGSKRGARIEERVPLLPPGPKRGGM